MRNFMLLAPTVECQHLLCSGHCIQALLINPWSSWCIEMPKRSKAEFIAELRQLADSTAEAALVGVEPCYTETVMTAAEKLSDFAKSMARKKQEEEPPPPIIELPPTATDLELNAARMRQAARRGRDVYLPSWSTIARALPDAFLRSALFESSSHVQRSSGLDTHQEMVRDYEVASLNNLRLLLSGYRLCQYDREVYSACLDYYRERPLAPGHCTGHVQTTFHEFAARLGGTHNGKTYAAIRSSLLRLSFAQLRIHYARLNIEIPKLLSVSLEDGAPTNDMRGSDILLLRVTEQIAELFGPAAWTAIDALAVGYPGLRGWLVNFYATHSKPHWLPVSRLYELSGYKSRMNNFRIALVDALTKLKSPDTPLSCRISSYQFSKDGKRIHVVRAEWSSRSDV